MMLTATKPQLLEHFTRVREQTEKICLPLHKEDYVVQPIADVSPPKWHLGHTTWFFEEMILSGQPDYEVYNTSYSYLFNSYYESVGARVIRTDRGNITRPGVEEVYKYRQYVNEAMGRLIDSGPDEKTISLITLGLQHEQQHQELLIYDIKYILGNNPLMPEYASDVSLPSSQHRTMDWLPVVGDNYHIGYEGTGFSFDNEHGRHQVYLEDFAIADRLVTNAEYLQFIEAGGYKDFRYWLSEGWEWVKTNHVEAPAYWHYTEGQWHQYHLLNGLQPMQPHDPVCHISFYEADAYARWAGLRLPTEAEWEVACQQFGRNNEHANFSESGFYKPLGAETANNQFYGDLWEWTASAYRPYPRYAPPAGAVGEYNGKFMINQMVLRGGSCATPQDHIRATYRNFFHPHLRWMLSGIRLAKYLE